jgi:hypothetical protein
VSGIRRALLAAAATTISVGVLVPAAASAATVTPIASGLDNPRGLSIGPDGRLYVAEAGHAGNTCLPPEHTGEEPFCAGFTGGITEISRKGVHRVLSGIISFGGSGGFAATGLDGVAAQGAGGLYAVITESIPGLERDALPFSGQELALAKTQVGRLIQAHPSGNWRAVAAVGDVDFRWTEEHFKELFAERPQEEQPPDANPYGIFVSGGERWVADAAANTVDEVRPNGSVRVVAAIPNPPVSDAVPTCVDRGPDGAIYVGQLTGFGNGPGKANIWRIAGANKPEIWASGLTAVTGCGFAPNGHFYATEFSVDGWEAGGPSTGALVEVPPHSTSPTVVASGLSFPNGFAADSHGALYVSNWSIAPAFSGGGPTGEVVRITP